MKLRYPDGCCWRVAEAFKLGFRFKEDDSKGKLTLSTHWKINTSCLAICEVFHRHKTIHVIPVKCYKRTCTEKLNLLP